MESKGKLVPKNERILRAAEAVFSKKGYRQATLDEIVKIADTGKGTVYKYFNNKENLFYTLIHMKNEVLLDALRHSVYEYTTFEDRFRHYFRALTLFLDKNIVLWSVLLLEIMSPQAGWQLIWNDEKEDYDVVTRWGKDLSLAEIETQRRYFDIIRSEVEQLRRIFQRGVDDKFLKPVGDMKRMSGNIYFSYTMTILQGFITPTNMDEAIELFLDRFLHGHCNQKG